MKTQKVSKSTKALLDSRKINICDLGCGGAKQNKDWFGVDIRALPGVDLVQNLESFPWPIPSESFNTVVMSHVLEHIQKANGIMLSFFNEIHRILKPEGEVILSVPYATSPGFYRDPTHTSPINEELFSYFSPDDNLYNGGLYHIYSPLPWKIKNLVWNMSGNLECVLVKRDILPEYNVDPEYLKILKKHTKLMK